MAATLRIQHGTPGWASQAIVPSKDTVVSPASTPALATVNVTAAGIYVYVKVENIGTVDLGTCTCTGAAWTPIGFFGGFQANNSPFSQTLGGVMFSIGGFGDSLSGGVSYSFGLPASGRRTWAWSPDGKFFAYAASPNGNDWFLTIVALTPITRSNGTTVAKGMAAVSGANGIFSGLWNNSNFAWAASNAVVVSGVGAGGGTIARAIACPYAPGTNTWGETIPSMPAQVDWTYLSSPCGAVVVLLPRVLAGGSQNAFLVSTKSAQILQFKQNNVPTSVSISGAAPSITTVQHAAKGVQINTGGGIVQVDDPDCMPAAVGGSVIVRVDRVKASTLPTANLGVVGVGQAVVGLLPANQSVWAQVVNSSGWANASEKHWCLLAQAFTSDQLVISRPWNGQAVNPPPFPGNNVNCAQRNIDILP